VTYRVSAVLIQRVAMVKGEQRVGEGPRPAEVWLGTNRRALALGILLPGLVAGVSLAALVWLTVAGRASGPLVILFLLLTIGPLWVVGQMAYAMWQPRIGYCAGKLLVYLDSPTRPTEIPIEVVECFFLGQGGSQLPKLKGREPETQNVIVRLAESAEEWKHRDVRPALGNWCEGYITIRGSWCERITPELMRRMNGSLAEVKAAARNDQ
jgi:hypothetical protein